MTARAQGPASPAEADCVDPRLFVGSTHADRRFSAAYGRFVLMADRGDAGAASAALFMYRHGQSLFGSDWSATEGQQARWRALALDATRQATVLPNRADD